MAVKSGTRSTNGCWTCRLRRKKCDETHPFCQACVGLSIACHGYGPRPPWMDRGPRERETADKVKSAIAQSATRKRRFRPDSICSATSVHAETERDSCGSSQPSPTYLLNSQPASSSQNQPEQLKRQSFSNPAISSSSEPCNSPGFQSEHTSSYNDFTTPSKSWRNEGPSSLDGADLSLSPLELFSPTTLSLDCEMSLNFLDHEPTSLESTNPFNFDTLNKQRDDESSNTLVASIGSNQISTTKPSQIHPAPRRESIPWSIASINTATDNTTPSSCYSGAFPLSDTGTWEVSAENALLVSYYTNKVVPMQFPFSQDHLQWLQFMLLQARPVMEISIILSRVLYLSEETGSEHSESANGDYEHHMGRAIAALKTLPSSTATMSLLDEDRRTSQAIAACTALVQIIHLEVFYGGSKNWESCLVQARPYMQTLIDLAVSRADVPPSKTGRLSGAVPQIHRAAAKALLEKLVWFDMIATISTGQGPFLGIDHGYLLGTDAIDVSGVSGCQNEVVKALCEIHKLKQWKTQAESQGRLSVMDLAARGSSLAQTLNNIIEGLKETKLGAENLPDVVGIESTPRKYSADYSNVVDEWNQKARTEMTAAFARAGVVYLHVVVSGPNPQLAEIGVATAELIRSLESLAANRLIEHVSWPLCVAGCFLIGEGDGKLGKYIDAARDRSSSCMRHRPSGSWLASLEIAQECGRLRQQDARNCDWMTVMQHLGMRVLLG
ncbi:fungal-specific transcription factor domain-containing protein [Annulohypoxylon moriforme]|nr:fungal-specific transcription factor domain-containing protein [Annulohypoxylon moriforme]